MRAVPPGLATPRAPPGLRATQDPAQVARAGQGAGVPELDRLVDARVKSKATLAPLAIFVLVALIVVIYLGARELSPARALPRGEVDDQRDRRRDDHEEDDRRRRPTGAWRRRRAGAPARRA